MSPFLTVNKLVNELTAKHANGKRLVLSNDAASQTYRNERETLLAQHGWTSEDYQERVDEYVSDHEVSE